MKRNDSLLVNHDKSALGFNVRGLNLENVKLFEALLGLDNMPVEAKSHLDVIVVLGIAFAALDICQEVLGPVQSRMS